MPVSALAAFWLLSLLLIAVPGPDWAFVLGAPRVLPAVAGLAAGYSALTVLVAAGVGALVARSAVAMTALTVAGGGYLIWHGARTLVRRPGPLERAATTGLFRQGVAVSALNPKGLLLFVALLPQFSRPSSAWPVWLQLAALGLTFVLTCVAFYLALGSVSRAVAAARPGVAAWTTRLAGAAMLGLGAALLVQRFTG
ncbi:LysE family translocator [Dactylosporangium sp. NPDC049140]|uniref:LysE family translocator n=1 Tax=Dactylosporangium sp. NPDC049140 TaxID=3155647 RepID=UPI0034046BA1